MKRLRGRARGYRHRVAPRAGAWIETIRNRYMFAIISVAPRAGAWIETAGYQAVVCRGWGRPPRGGVD